MFHKQALSTNSHVQHEFRYYWRRFSRIAPSLYSMLVLVYLFVLPAIRARLVSDDAWYTLVHPVLQHDIIGVVHCFQTSTPNADD